MESGQALWETLQRMGWARRYAQWIVAPFLPYVGENVLEVGCGIGNLTPYFLHARRVVSLDPLPEAITQVQRRWGHHPHFTPLVGDITDSALLEQLRPYRFDTIVFINVLEHIEDDRRALTHAQALLQPGGHVLIHVPACPILYGSLDIALGHHRRYTRAALLSKVEAAGFTPLACQPVNILGILGWWVNGRLCSRTVLPAAQVRLFDRLVPFLRIGERFLRALWPEAPGLSLACVARKPPPPSHERDRSDRIPLARTAHYVSTGAQGHDPDGPVSPAPSRAEGPRRRAIVPY